MTKQVKCQFLIKFILIIIVVTSTDKSANGNALYHINMKSKAYYRFKNDTLTISSTGLVTRKWLHTQAGLLTVSYKQNNTWKEWCNSQLIYQVCDWHIPGKMDQNTRSDEVNDSHFTSPHLVLEAHFKYDFGLEVSFMKSGCFIACTWFIKTVSYPTDEYRKLRSYIRGKCLV